MPLVIRCKTMCMGVWLYKYACTMQMQLHSNSLTAKIPRYPSRLSSPCASIFTDQVREQLSELSMHHICRKKCFLSTDPAWRAPCLCISVSLSPMSSDSWNKTLWQLDFTSMLLRERKPGAWTTRSHRMIKSWNPRTSMGSKEWVWRVTSTTMIWPSGGSVPMNRTSENEWTWSLCCYQFFYHVLPCLGHLYWKWAVDWCINANF